MNTGLIASEIRTAVQSITSIEKHLDAVFGFGSFFRGELFRDIDVLAVTSQHNSETLRTFYLLSEALDPISVRCGCPVHLTMFTPAEFHAKPLRDMHELQTLWRAGKP
jgi:predicted nucleotidyltransferase